MNRMDGKVCVIAGATQGLGAAIARRLAAAGAAAIVVTGRNATRGAAVAEQIEAAYRVPALFVRGDLGLVEDCRRMIADADRRFHHVHVLVNAGALTERGTISTRHRSFSTGCSQPTSVGHSSSCRRRSSS